jgi:hypothetical protein
MKSDHE